MSLEEYGPALYEQYQGEVTGEVALNRLLVRFQSPRQQYLLGTVLQLETETKARLRATVALLGLDIVESEEAQRAGNELADVVDGLDWQSSMKTLGDALTPVVTRFEDIAEIGPEEYQDLAESMVVHEKLIKQLFDDEAQGAGLSAAAEISSQLRFALPELN